MTNSYPAHVPTGYAGTYRDFLDVRRDVSGATRQVYNSISVADSASAGTTYGLIPFQAGATVDYGSKLYTPDLDTGTNVTWNLGYLLEDSATAGAASDADAFISLGSGQAASILSFDEFAGMSFIAPGNGWIVAKLAAGPVTTAGTIQFRGGIAYENPLT